MVLWDVLKQQAEKCWVRCNAPRVTAKELAPNGRATVAIYKQLQTYAS